MHSKGRYFLFLLLLFILAAAAPVMAAPQEAASSDAPAEEVIEYEEPEGLVHLEPEFEWTGEDRFLLSFRVSNRTDVLIPETEIIMQFSGEEEKASFDGTVRTEPEEYPGTALFTGEQQVLTVLLTDLQPGDDYRFYAEGAVPKESSLPDIQASLILRGYGLEHSTESRIEVPDRVAEEEPEEEITVLLVVRLLENGKESIPAHYAYLYNYSSDIYISGEAEQRSRRMHFLPFSGERGDGRAPLPALIVCAAGVMLSSFAVMNHFLVKRALRRRERRSAGRLYNSYKTRR